MFRYKAIQEAYSNEGVHWVNFDIKDSPALLWPDTFCLSGLKKRHRTLKTSSVSRGHPVLDLFEGDTIEDEETGDHYTVTYYNGFKTVDLETGEIGCVPVTFKKISDGTHEIMKLIQTYNRTPIKFKAHSSLVFYFTDFVVSNGVTLDIFAKNSKPRRVLADNIVELVFIDDEGMEHFEGEIYEGIFIDASYTLR